MDLNNIIKSKLEIEDKTEIEKLEKIGQRFLDKYTNYIDYFSKLTREISIKSNEIVEQLLFEAMSDNKTKSYIIISHDSNAKMVSVSIPGLHSVPVKEPNVRKSALKIEDKPFVSKDLNVIANVMGINPNYI